MCPPGAGVTFACGIVRLVPVAGVVLPLVSGRELPVVPVVPVLALVVPVVPVRAAFPVVAEREPPAVLVCGELPLVGRLDVAPVEVAPRETPVPVPGLAVLVVPLGVVGVPRVPVVPVVPVRPCVPVVDRLSRVPVVVVVPVVPVTPVFA